MGNESLEAISYDISYISFLNIPNVALFNVYELSFVTKRDF